MGPATADAATVNPPALAAVTTTLIVASLPLMTV
jgi:hypothetical protein